MMQFATSTCRTLIALALLLCVLALPGCNGYVLQGKVVRGSASSIDLVVPEDERMTADGVPTVDVRIVRDPASLNRHLVGQARSDSTGEFAIIMSEFGTGWMSEQWQVQGIAPGFQNADITMQLPSKHSKWRLLITLGPGVSEPPHDEDLMQDLEKFK